MTEEMNGQNAPTNPAPQPVPTPQPTPAPQPTPVPTPQQVPYPQSVPQAPPMQGYAPMPTAPVLTELSGGMKFGWLVIGLLMGIPGMLLSWLVNVDKMPKVKSDAIKFSVIGFVINIVGAIILSFALSAFFVAFIYEIANSVPSSYYY